MKIINEKGKLFGIINVVDFIAVLVVIIVAGGVLWKVLDVDVTDIISSQMKSITYTVRIPAATESYFDQLESFGFPQQLVSGSDYVANAYIVSAVTEPYKVYGVNSSGKSVVSNDPTRIDIIVTIEAEVREGPCITIGSQEVRVGKTHIVKSDSFEMSGTTETLTIKAQ